MPDTATVAVMLAALAARPLAIMPRAAITWNDVAASYARVHDYTCLYEKQERAISNGELQRIRLSFRKPMDVRLEWLNDKDEVDQIAVYRRGFNEDKVMVRRRGILGAIAGTLRLDPRSRTALQDSRHPITDVGLGHIVDEIARERDGGRATVRLPIEDTVDAQPVYRFEFDGAPNVQVFGIDGASRAVVWIERLTQLPMKVELLDAGGRALERHRFKDVRLNVGLTDAAFVL